MVPITENAARRRLQELAALNGTRTGYSLSRPKLQQAPRITYSKRDRRSFSLTANQFRPDIFAIPPDEGKECNSQSQASRVNRATKHDALAEESRLPGDALSPSARAYTRARAGKGIRQRKPITQANREAPVSIAATESSRAHSKKGTAQAVKTPKKKPAYPREERGRTVKTKDAEKRKAARTSTTKLKTTKTRTPARRLPLDELFLVASPLNSAPEIDPQSPCPGIQTQDPIHDSSSSPRKRRLTSSSSDNEATTSKRPKASLSVLRERFEFPKYRHKKLRSRSSGGNAQHMFELLPGESNGRDGFEDSELTVKPHIRRLERRSRRKEHPVLGIGALQLGKGPLPDVDFGFSTSELRFETQYNKGEGNGESPEHTEQRDYDDQLILAFPAPRRRVSFSDSAREKLIRAQLSSISAPERVPSDSDDSDVEEDEEADDKDGNLEDDNDSDLLGPDDQTNRSSSVKITEDIAKNSDRRPLHQHAEQRKPKNVGVTLDFRPVPMPGQLPRQTLGKRSLVEVNEAIVEVPESDFPPEEHHLNSIRPQVPSRVAIEQRDRQILSSRRSILKNSTPAIPDSTTLPQQTRANTRRNSIVDAAGSRYFTTATNILEAPDLTKYKVIPHQSRYFYSMDVEMPGTERVVPETSPEPASHIDSRNVHVQRGDTDEQGMSKQRAASKRPGHTHTINWQGAWYA